MSPKQLSSGVPGTARARRRWRVAAADGPGPRRVAAASGPDASRAGQPVSEFQRTRLLNAALDAGLNVIDTAECYAAGADAESSEELIGAAVGSKNTPHS